MRCPRGHQCEVELSNSEAYCQPNCSLNPCEPGEICEVQTVFCFRAPCPGLLNCRGVWVLYVVAAHKTFEARIFVRHHYTSTSHPLSCLLLLFRYNCVIVDSINGLMLLCNASLLLNVPHSGLQPGRLS